MTKLLTKAFETASDLPPDAQDEVARWLLQELEGEARWAKAFAGSQDALAGLADEALEEHRNGRTESLDPEAL